MWIPTDNITIANRRASSGGSSYQNTDTLKENAKIFAFSQYRCVTKRDYKGYLEQKTTIEKATAWGQQELREQSDVRDYNKVYITLIPTSWGLSSISTENELWTLENGNSTYILSPQSYLNSFKEDIETYLEPYKTLSTYHSFNLPELVYFAFDMSLSVYRNYSYSVVMNDIQVYL
jgi:hypothetical protein